MLHFLVVFALVSLSRGEECANDEVCDGTTLMQIQKQSMANDVASELTNENNEKYGPQIPPCNCFIAFYANEACNAPYGDGITGGCNGDSGEHSTPDSEWSYMKSTIWEEEVLFKPGGAGSFDGIYCLGKKLKNDMKAYKIYGDCSRVEIYDEDGNGKGYSDNIVVLEGEYEKGKCELLPDDFRDDLGGFMIEATDNGAAGCPPEGYTTPSPTPQWYPPENEGCEWEERANSYSGGYPAGISTKYSTIAQAKGACISLGKACKAITCNKGGICTMRKSEETGYSDGETTYLPNEKCLNYKPPPTDEECWEERANSYSGGYPLGISTKYSTVAESKRQCLMVGACKAITCNKGGICTMRKSEETGDSKNGETTYMKRC